MTDWDKGLWVARNTYRRPLVINGAVSLVSKAEMKDIWKGLDDRKSEAYPIGNEGWWEAVIMQNSHHYIVGWHSKKGKEPDWESPDIIVMRLSTGKEGI